MDHLGATEMVSKHPRVQSQPSQPNSNSAEHTCSRVRDRGLQKTLYTMTLTLGPRLRKGHQKVSTILTLNCAKYYIYISNNFFREQKHFWLSWGHSGGHIALFQTQGQGHRKVTKIFPRPQSLIEPNMQFVL